MNGSAARAQCRSRWRASKARTIIYNTSSQKKTLKKGKIKVNLIKEIFDWVKTLPLWQQDAARRLYENPSGLSEDDYAQLYSLFDNEYGLRADNSLSPRPMDSNQIIGEGGRKTIRLNALSGLRFVNAIDSTQKLRFAEEGLTVVYGENGSGKSGYARVFKRACFSRDKEEFVLPNVALPEQPNAEPQASFELSVDGEIETIDWAQWTKPYSPYLAQISVFDSKSARLVLTKEQELHYLPYGLDVLRDLGEKVIPKVKEHAQANLSAIDVGVERFNDLKGHNVVGDIFANLATAKLSDIEKLAEFPPGLFERGRELSQIIDSTDRRKDAKEIMLKAQRFRSLLSDVEKLTLKDEMSVVQNLIDDLLIKTKAWEVAKKAVANNVDFVKGVGGDLWKELFLAAREFALQEAYPGAPFPSEEDGTKCVLCLQPLGAEARERLKDFNAFVSGEVSRSMEGAKAKVSNEKRKLADMLSVAQSVMRSQILKEIESEDGVLYGKLNTALGKCKKTIECLIDHLQNLDKAQVLVDLQFPVRDLRDLIARQYRSYRRIIATLDEKRLAALSKERDDLRARYKLSRRIDEVKKWFARKERANGIASLIKEEFSTAKITTKVRELSSKAVTAELKAAIRKELRELGLTKHVVSFDYKVRGSAGKVLGAFAINSNLHQRVGVSDVMSEGELKVVALASFLAEINLINGSDPIVFDDPVTSLDLRRMRRIARRLVDESMKRQVVIFTHNPLLLTMLVGRAEHIKANMLIQNLCWSEQGAGKVNDGLPYEFGKWQDRLGSLKHRAKELRQRWTPIPNDTAVRELRSIYSDLRAVIERIVQDVFLNGTVCRFLDYIRVDHLNDVAGLQGSDVNAIVDKYHDICDFVNAHDAAPGSPSFPDPEQLGSDIATIEGIVKSVGISRGKKEKKRQTIL